MAFDRLVEWINLRQSERSSSFQSYDGALQFTNRMQPMLHVDAAFSAAALGNRSDADAGYDPRIEHQVRRLLRVFERDVGCDLTIECPNNPFWHTGIDVPLETARLENVAHGVTCGRLQWVGLPVVKLQHKLLTIMCRSALVTECSQCEIKL